MRVSKADGSQVLDLQRDALLGLRQDLSGCGIGTAAAKRAASRSPRRTATEASAIETGMTRSSVV